MVDGTCNPCWRAGCWAAVNASVGSRRAFLHEQGWPYEHIELQLAHQERNSVSAAYNHAQYLQPRAQMMQAWADYLDQRRNEEADAQEQRDAA
jgi:hypothetical protein